MEIIKTICPQCAKPLEFPSDFDNVTCPACGTAFHVRSYKGAINLSAVGRSADPAWPVGAETNGAGRLRQIEAELAEIEEEISNLGSRVEEMKSREQAAPLQWGCALFGVFGLVIAVLALFMTVGRTYFGGWLFYLSLAAIILLGAMRMRRKLANPVLIDQLRRERAILESALAELEAEQRRLQQLKDRLTSPGPQDYTEGSRG